MHYIEKLKHIITNEQTKSEFLSEQKQIELLKIFNNDFHKTIKKIIGDNHGILNYKKAVDLLIKLGFMHHPCEGIKFDVQRERQLLFDMWRALKGNENDGVTIRNFKLLLLGIMKFNF